MPAPLRHLARDVWDCCGSGTEHCHGRCLHLKLETDDEGCRLVHLLLKPVGVAQKHRVLGCTSDENSVSSSFALCTICSPSFTKPSPDFLRGFEARDYCLPPRAWEGHKGP